jgi:hypothetical protein
MTGEFVESYTKGKLEFTAHTIPEPSIYILLITARRRNAQS